MDFGSVYSLEDAHLHTFYNPEDPSKLLSAQVWVRSWESEHVRSFVRAEVNSQMARTQKGQFTKVEDVEESLLRKVAASIAKFEWNDDSIDGEKPDMTDMKTAIVHLDAIPWMFEQIKGVGENRTNFTNGQLKK